MVPVLPVGIGRFLIAARTIQISWRIRLVRFRKADGLPAMLTVVELLGQIDALSDPRLALLAVLGSMPDQIPLSGTTASTVLCIEVISHKMEVAFHAFLNTC
jgi:hypothetical protein